jgi:hypothetical protein
MAVNEDKPAPAATDDLVEKWFVEHFHGSIVATNTQMYNHVRSAVDELKKRLSPTLQQ